MNPFEDRVLYLFRQADKSLVFRYSLIIILAGMLRIPFAVAASCPLTELAVFAQLDSYKTR